MKKALIVLVGLMAVTAYAGDMNIFFSADNAVQHKTPGALDLGDLPAGDVTVYVYAQLDAYDYGVWNGLGIAFDAVGASLPSGALYNPNMGGDGTPKGGAKAFRFQNGSVAGSDPVNPIGFDADGDLAGAAVSSTSFTLLGIGALPRNGDYAATPSTTGDDLAYSNYGGVGDWLFTYLLGEITITTDGGPGGVDLGVANDWITLGGDEFPWATVSFGGDADEYSGRETGAGLNGAYNDVYWTPEPASMILLALGALVIRRR